MSEISFSIVKNEQEQEQEQEEVEEEEAQENISAPIVKLSRRERQWQQAIVNHKRRLAQEQHTAALTRKISQYKKENASLRDQLHRLMNQQGLSYVSCCTSVLSIRNLLSELILINTVTYI
jgi:molecular chaperone GrpE (heat shock protein)